MTFNLNPLRHLSAGVGSDPNLVQGGGGNSSVKENGRLWIKASGTWLAKAEQEDIFLAVDLDRLKRQIVAGHEDPTTDCYAAEAGKRPSIETTLHALMPHRVVLHTHAVNTIAWAVRRDRRETLAERLNGLAWGLVPYRRPGLPLTRAVETVLQETGTVDVLVLANHGLVVGGGDVDRVSSLTAEVEQRLEISPRQMPRADMRRLQSLCSNKEWRLPEDALVHAVACDPVCLGMARQGALYPDHVVFLDADLPVLDDGLEIAEMMRRHRATSGRAPVYLVLPDAGVLVARSITPGAEEMLRCLARVLLRLAAETPVTYLDAGDVADLVSWDAEQYRQAIDAGNNPADPAQHE